MSTLIIDVDNSRVKKELKDTEDEVSRSNLAMLTAIRQTAQAGILILQLSGVAIDQLFSLYIETLLVGAEVIGTLAAGSFGATLIFQSGQLIAMLILIRQIKQKKTEAAQKTSQTVQLLRLGTYRFIVFPIIFAIKIIQVIIIW